MDLYLRIRPTTPHLDPEPSFPRDSAPLAVGGFQRVDYLHRPRLEVE